MPSQTVTISHVPYYTLLEGPPTGPLIVLSHALMANHHMWDSAVLYLHSLGYRTLRYGEFSSNITRLTELRSFSIQVLHTLVLGGRFLGRERQCASRLGALS
jgi:hypothetical protein